MSQDESKTSNENTQRRGRGRDFAIMVSGGVGILTLLFMSGSLGVVEAITAAIVMCAGTLAFYIGSTPTLRNKHKAPSLEREPSETDQAALDAIEPFIIALPFAALLVRPNGRIATANDLARKLFRIPDASETPISIALRQPDLLAAADRVAATKAREMVEFTLHGEAETWMAHMQQAPEPGSVMIVFEDLTAVKRAERARADFLANASHELRTPLTAVGGFIETMRGPAKDDKASWDGFLVIMAQQTERMKRLVSDLLSLSRIEFGEHRTPSTIVEIGAIVTRASFGLEPIAKDVNVRLHLDRPDDEIRAVADMDEIIQVVQNLVGNAIKYTPKNGEVQIRVGTSPTMASASQAASCQIEGSSRALLLEPRASSEVPALWIRITDNGEGIPEQHLPRLAERFYRVDESRGGAIEGTGLGLAIVKHIMARHRGGFAVESVEGQGTAFGVWLPRAADSA